MTNHMKRVISILLTAVLLLSVLTSTAILAASLPFVDVKSGDWYYAAVEQMYSEGLIMGRTETSFDPRGTMKRAELVTLMARIAGESTSGCASSVSFKDVKRNSWYADAVGWAVQRGIVNGYDGNVFMPEAPILRQEFAAMIVRFINYIGAVIPKSPAIERFTDYNKIPKWASDDIEALRVMGLFAGDENGRLNPASTLTRGEAATLAARLVTAIRRDVMYGIFDRAEELVDTENGRIVIELAGPETFTGNNLDIELLWRVLGLDIGTYTLITVESELESARGGAYASAAVGDKVDITLTLAVKNKSTLQVTDRKTIALTVKRGDDISEQDYPEFYYKIKLDGTAEITDYIGSSSVRELTIPSMLGGVKVTSIGEEAFSSSRELEAVVIPDGISKIGKRAFELCTSLKGISLPDSVTDIGRGAFYYCTSLKAVRLPRELESIPDYMFYMCTSLEAVLPPEQLREIGVFAFCNCAVKKFVFNDGLERVDDYAFEGCAFTSVEIPNSCEYIGSFAFYNCKGLTDAYIGVGLEKLGSGIFYGSSVTEIRYGGTKAQFGLISSRAPFEDDKTVIYEGGAKA